ncbi:Superoxide dismutase [Cu-Zn] [Perkinsus olseni]|uniref:Superoxide dismutase [Cu-Zn] n=1 Tax=Perkinsus olseni TaxID=32597 RepID=A0A7J6P444_PEROL|nr:Superoxide dismutase [Cu-Zn] [Perkinsus olseni]
MFLKTLSILPLAAAQLSGSESFRGTPKGCLQFVQSKTSANASVCSVAFDKNCPTDYPVRCDDIQPFPRAPPRFPIKAKAKLEPFGSGSGVNGTIYFEQESFTRTKVSYEIYNLEPNSLHGTHVHELSTFTPNGCLSAGGHYNPYRSTHGDVDSDVRHVGDMGNFVADEFGVSKGSFYTDLIVLYGPVSVVSRSVVVHSGEDDLGQGGNAGSLTTGNSGSRLVCGEIVKYQ